jgi:demethylmenaquinone methyltransferase/2-methoxy-6-polyprenyl-1,4-benzoquinol methylase
MFNDVSRRYDFLNHFLSGGIDRRWRKRALEILQLRAGESFLDVACGTGDLSIEAARKAPSRIVGVDFAEKMLRIFVEKKKKLDIDENIDTIQADAERLPFADETFDVAAVAFGVRNFGNLKAGLSELYRVIRKEGRVVVLEFSKPRGLGIRQVYLLYFTRFLPVIGRLISGDRGAYSYLPNSVMDFPDGGSFENILREANFHDVRMTAFTFGIATAYFGRK